MAEIERFEQCLAEVRRAARFAWQQCACPSLTRLWLVGLELAEWSADEQTHLEQCPKCRSAIVRIRQCQQH
jgi:hypothetical protein